MGCGNVAEHIGKPGLGIDAVELGGLDQGVGDGGGFTAAFRADKKVILAALGYRLHGPLGGVVIGHADIGVSISRPVFPSVVVVRVSGIGASECEEAGRPNRQ